MFDFIEILQLISINESSCACLTNVNQANGFTFETMLRASCLFFSISSYILSECIRRIYIFHSGNIFQPNKNNYWYLVLTKQVDSTFRAF